MIPKQFAELSCACGEALDMRWIRQRSADDVHGRRTRAAQWSCYGQLDNGLPPPDSRACGSTVPTSSVPETEEPTASCRATAATVSSHEPTRSNARRLGQLGQTRPRRDLIVLLGPCSLGAPRMRTTARPFMSTHTPPADRRSTGPAPTLAAGPSPAPPPHTRGTRPCQPWSRSASPTYRPPRRGKQAGTRPSEQHGNNRTGNVGAPRDHDCLVVITDRERPRPLTRSLQPSVSPRVLPTTPS